MAQSDDIRPEAGVVLIAPPMLGDPNFRRTVVLLCEHGPDGTFGLILNRPLPLQLEDVMNGLTGYPDALSLGGPVQPNTLHFLHRFGERLPGAVAVEDGVYWGGDFEVMKELIATEALTARDVRFFLGYSGWSAGQLDDEIEQGGWFLTRTGGDVVFAGDPGALWRRVLRQMGGEYAVLANFPDDPRMN